MTGPITIVPAAPAPIVKTGNPALQRYAAALIGIVLTVVAALTQLPDGAISAGTLIQLAALTVGSIGVYLLPLVDGPWRGIAKTGCDVVAAALAAVLPLAVQGGTISTMQLAVVVLAVLKVLGTEVGVQLREDPGD